MQIEFVTLKKQYKSIRSEIDAAVRRVITSQFFVLGKELENFERSYAKYLGARYVVGVDNGSDALVLALQALGIGPGDEVITPVNSYIATTLAITELGAKPAFVDADPETHQIDIQQVKKKINKKTKAILPVHLYGAPCDVKALVKLCKKHKIHLVEDAAQAHGSTMHRKKLGTFGIMSIYSFYPAKNLGAYGQGGAIATSSKALYLKLLQLRNFGMTKRYYHDVLGKNSKLDDIQAAVLGVKLKHLNVWNKKRNAIAKLYKKGLGEKFHLPSILQGGTSNYHLFVIECQKRDNLQKYLLKKGIKSQIHYPVPIHLQKCYSYLGYKRGDFPVAERLARQILSLPMYAELTAKEVAYVTRTISDFYKR